MNYKNNLLSKKKYKIVNQKAGGINEWTLTIKLPDKLQNVDKFEPFKITILQDSGISGGYLGFGYWYGLERVVNGVKLKAEFKKNETDFINTLYKYSEKNVYTFDDELKKKLDQLRLTPNMLKFIAATIAFPPCFPTSFKTLHETAKTILTGKYNKAKKKCTDKKILNPMSISRCGVMIDWMIHFKENIEKPTNIDVC
jgi:hypothetical protein